MSQENGYKTDRRGYYAREKYLINELSLLTCNSFIGQFRSSSRRGWDGDDRFFWRVHDNVV